MVTPGNEPGRLAAGASPDAKINGAIAADTKAARFIVFLHIALGARPKLEGYQADVASLPHI